MTQMLRFSSLTTDQQTAVDAIDLSGENLLGLVNDIIKLAKIEAGTLHLDRYEFSLHKIIHDVVASQTPHIHEKHVSLHTEFLDGVSDLLVGDMLRIKLILQNLLANAVTASKNGDIYITVSMLQHDSQKASLQLSVRDAGIPIPQARLKSIFTPFDGLNRTNSDTGLGLSICRRLAELMGGRIWAENAEGGGNTFHLVIPVEIGNTSPETSSVRKTHL
jgi:signal transduction histidine kinase